jgi:hypothetical protein
MADWLKLQTGLCHMPRTRSRRENAARRAAWKVPRVEGAKPGDCGTVGAVYGRALFQELVKYAVIDAPTVAPRHSVGFCNRFERECDDNLTPLPHEGGLRSPHSTHDSYNHPGEKRIFVGICT